jgi:hypothetical protein|nr:MAG TPA: hypothetical protein [Caudoviricetes sp.]
MRVIENTIIPFKEFAGINLFGVLFIRKGVKVSERMLNHEKIHTAQMKEMLFVFFYLWYFIEWMIRLFIDHKTAYKSISFEREAYANDEAPYLPDRRPYGWIKYLSKAKL